VAFLGATAPLFPQSSSANKTYTLSAVTFSGAKKFTQEQLISASGLKKGQQIDLAGIDSAAGRLFKTGAVAKIGYTYRTTATSIDVQFTVAEASQFLTCTYDNFVWFRDDELVAAARKTVPLFDGSLPVGGDLSDQVTESLETFLQEHSIKASVIATMTGSLGGKMGGLDLRISGISIPVVAVNVKGGPLSPEALAKAIHVLSLNDYSRSVTRGAGQSGLTETCQDEGYLQAKFADPQIAMKDPLGRNASLGVIVSYDVVPGPQYNWSGISWKGNLAISENDLTALLEVKPGDIARRDKLNWSWVAVHDRYGRQGYLTARIDPAPEFDVPQHLVHYSAVISEGPQFRMGEFSATGVPELVANQLKQAWRLRAGQVYDASYENTFMQKDMGAVMRPSATTRFTITFHRKLDPTTHIVDVELEIK